MLFSSWYIRVLTSHVLASAYKLGVLRRRDLASNQVLSVWRRMEQAKCSSFVGQSEPRGFMEEEDMEVGSLSSFSGDEEEEEDESINSDVGSFEEEEEEELREDATSSSSSLSSCPASSAPSSLSSNDTTLEEGPLFEMSSLMSILPLKRGLSKHYDGKSQSFGSLSDAACLEDLAKPEMPLRKKLKSSQSYPGVFVEVHRPLSVTVSSRAIAKKAPRSYAVSPPLRSSSRRHRLSNSNPPVPLQRPVGPSDHPLLFSSRGFACMEALPDHGSLHIA